MRSAKRLAWRLLHLAREVATQTTVTIRRLHMKLVQVLGTILLAGAGAAMASDMTTGSTSSSTSPGAQPGTMHQETNTTTSSTSSKSMDKGSFDALDTNKDGYLTKMEAEQAGAMPDFTTADKNGDGQLDATEFAAAKQQSMSSSESSTSESRSVTSSGQASNEDEEEEG